MAAKSKNKKSTKKTNTKKKSKPVNKETGFMKDEISIWITLAVSVLILLSNFGICGFVGDVISSVLKDGFGLVSYLVPFILFGCVSFAISNKGNITAYVKLTSVVILSFLLCTFLHLVHKLGGWCGDKIASLLTPAIGVAGTYVVIIVCMVICTVIITGKSILGGVKKQSGKAYNKAFVI